MKVTVKAGQNRQRDYSGVLTKMNAMQEENWLCSGECLYALFGYDVEMRLADGTELLISGVKERYINISNSPDCT